MKKKTEKAIFGAGCFWHVELAFSKVPGVIEVKSGYSGGKMENPSYEDVCNNETGHAEAVQVTYEPEKVTYEKLLEIFWKIHDPTQVNRQGPDVGAQYRSVVFYFDDSQRKIAEESKKKEEGKIGKKIATEIVKAGKFYEAEEYHQKYLIKRGKDSCYI